MKRISKRLHLSHIFAFVIAALFMAMNVNAGTEEVNIKLEEERTTPIVVDDGERVTLDLNGNNITVTNGHAILVNEGGTLTITGTGTVTAKSASYGAIFNNGGTVTVNGGEYIATGWYAIKNLGTMTINDATVGGTLQKQNSSLVANGFYGNESNYPKNGTDKVLLTINGGKFTHLNTTSTIKGDDWSKTVINDGEFVSKQGFLIQASGTVEVNGGKFTGYYSVATLYGFNESAYPGILTITGGDFEAKYIARADNDGELTITGGDFTKVTEAVINPKKMCKNNTMCAYTTIITGGTFNTNVIPDVSENYQVVTLADKNVVDKKLELNVNNDIYYVEKGKTINVDYTANDTAKKYLEMYSEDKSIATISDGVITGVKAGIVNMTFGIPGSEEGITVYVYEVVPEETTETESNNVSTESAVAISNNVSSILSDILAGKENIKGIDTATSEKIAAAVKEGNTITTELENKEVKADDLSKETTEKVEKVLNKDEKIAVAFDINVLIKQNNQSIGKLTELIKKVVITVDVPKDIPTIKKGYSRTYYIIRVHDGLAERLETKYDNGKLSFETDKFSDYVLVYEDVANTELDDTPKTGDISYVPVIMTISILGLGAVKVLKRN
jgi:hypothetical protein